MRYDRTFKRYNFSTSQFISHDERSLLIEDFNQFRHDMLRTDIRDFGREMYGAAGEIKDDDPSGKAKSIVITAIAILAFISLILALVLKQIMIFGTIFCALFLICGIMLIFTGRSDLRDSASKAIRNRIMGVAITLASIGILSLILLHDRFSQAELIVWITSLAFGLAGLTLIALAIVDKLSAKIIYTEEIDAKCVGYVRMVDSERSDNTTGTVRSHPIIYIMTSPLFEYHYAGEKYEALYDTFPIRDDSDIALDTFSKIKINPRHPEDVMSPHVASKTNFAILLIFGIIFAAAGSGLAWYSLLGNTKDLTVETSWNNLIDLDEVSLTTKVQITDEMVEDTYKDDIGGKDWYSEITTITNVEDYEGNLLLTFDDTFEKMLVKAGTDLKTGDQVLLLYTVSLETPDQETAYKQAFVYGKTDTMEYTGTHKAFVK